MGSRIRAWTACIAVAILAGCGGGGSSAPPSSGNAPTPAPSPTPTPTPTPTPPPTYAFATDFSADRQYAGWGVEAVADYKAPPFGSPSGTRGTTTYTVSLKPETLGAGFSFTAATRTYVVRWVDFTKSYGPTVDGLNSGRQPFSAVDDFVRYHPWIDNASQDYARYFGAFNWSRFEGSNSGGDFISRRYASIFGVKTLPSDLPSTGLSRLTFFPALEAVNPPRTTDGSDIYRLAQDAWSAQIDWPSRRITGTLRLDPSPAAPAGTQPLAIAMAGTIDADRTSISGQFSGSGIGGEFTGNLFGPQGREVGFAYRITIAGGEAYAGATGARGT